MGQRLRTARMITNAAPTASFNVGTITGYTIVVSSTSKDTDGTIATISWDWGDSTALGTVANTIHTYVNQGTYLIKLTITDNLGATSTKNSSVTVPSVLPVAQYTVIKNK